MLDFKATLQRRIKTLDQQHSTGDMAANWYDVRKALIDLPITQKTLDKPAYESICQQHDIADSEAFLRYLHNTGVVSYYEGLFNNQVILRTDWVLDAMYALLKLEGNPLARLQGKLTKADFAEVWKAKYTTDEQKLFIDYMLKSELIAEPFQRYQHTEYQHTEHQRGYQYLVPAMFPTDKPHEKIQWTQQPRYIVVKFRFLYRAIMQRLQVRVLTHCHVSVEEDLYQNRISFTDRTGHTAHIEVIEPDNKIRAWADKEMRIWAEDEALYRKIVAELDRISQLARVTLLERKQGQPDQQLSLDSLRHQSNEERTQGFDTPLPTPTTMKDSISIFVTYRWSNVADQLDNVHQNRVMAFVNALREHQFDATFDLYESETQTAPDFIEMMYKHITGSEKVIIVLSEGYAKSANAYKGGVGVEYRGIMNDIEQHPRKYCLVSFGERGDTIYPFGLKGRDTVMIQNGNLEDAENAEEKNWLFTKLLDEAMYTKPPKGGKSATVRKK